ncbi:MAG: Ig-like domain-containing protein, partial [Prevotella sp.]
MDAYKNAQGWKELVVKAIGSVAESLTLNNSELTLNEGETYQLTYTVLPETADAPTVEWTSSNPEIATVDENGKVTAIALGSATITVKTTDGTDISASCNVTVQESPNTDITTMDDVIYVEHAKALTGKSVTLSLKMKHEMKVAGFQFNMVLPENFTIANVTRGEGIKGLDDDDEYIYTFNNSDKEDGSRFFLCYSTTNTAMPEGDIEIAKVVVNVPEGIEPGEYGVILKNAELAYGTEKKVIDYVKGSISVTDYIIGDANNDGIISVVDITTIGQYLLDGDDTKINLAAADANGDGIVSVADITTIAVMILNAEN